MKKTILSEFSRLHALHKESAQASGHSMMGLRAREKLLSHWLKKNDHSKASILDLACGNGAFMGGLRERNSFGWDLTGVDALPEALETAKNSYGYRALYACDFFLESMPVLSEQFDLVICSELLHYLPIERIGELFSGWKTALKAEGRLLLLMPNRNSLIHRMRRAVFGEGIDYRYDHKPSAVLAALSQTGYDVRSIYGAEYFSAAVGALDPFRVDGWWHFSVLVEAAPRNAHLNIRLRPAAPVIQA